MWKGQRTPVHLSPEQAALGHGPMTQHGRPGVHGSVLIYQSQTGYAINSTLPPGRLASLWGSDKG